MCSPINPHHFFFTTFFALQDPNLARLCADLRANASSVGECGGRLLRLKRYLPDAGAPPGALDALIDALAANDTVQVLYLQNLTHFSDAHLAALTARVLTRVSPGVPAAASPRRASGGGGGGGPRARPRVPQPSAAAPAAPPAPALRPRVWAVNLGELPSVTEAGWAAFTAALPRTGVAFLYMSEHVLADPGLKDEMRAAARANRTALLASRGGAPPPSDLCARTKNMWFNPGAWRDRLVGGAGRAGGVARPGQGGQGGRAARARRAGRPGGKTEWSASAVAVPPPAQGPPPPPSAFLTSRQWAMREEMERAAAAAAVEEEETEEAQEEEAAQKKEKEASATDDGGRTRTVARPPASGPAIPPASPPRMAAAPVVVRPSPGRAGGGRGSSYPPATSPAAAVLAAASKKRPAVTGASPARPPKQRPEVVSEAAISP